MLLPFSVGLKINSQRAKGGGVTVVMVAVSRSDVINCAAAGFPTCPTGRRGAHVHVRDDDSGRCPSTVSVKGFESKWPLLCCAWGPETLMIVQWGPRWLEDDVCVRCLSSRPPNQRRRAVDFDLHVCIFIVFFVVVVFSQSLSGGFYVFFCVFFTHILIHPRRVFCLSSGYNITL